MRLMGLGARAGGKGSRAMLGPALASALVAATASACLTAVPPRTSPPGPQTLILPGFRASPPARRGWRGVADRPSRTASFSKKSIGLIDETYADIFVRPLFVPPGLWPAAGEELVSAVLKDYAEATDLGPVSDWKRRSVRDRKAAYLSGKENADLSEEEIRLRVQDEDVSARKRVLFGLYLPPDLERAHRFFEIVVEFTEVFDFIPVREDRRVPLLDAVVKGLETVGPFDDLPGPSGDLARAVLAGDAEAARRAVEAGADAGAGLPDWTPFELAAFCDRRDLAGILDWDGGLAAVFGDRTASSPFLLALVAGRPGIATFLLETERPPGAGPPAGPPPLALAAALGHAEIVTWLLERGAAADAPTGGGWTPLMLACESGAAACAEALLAGGADPDLRSESGATALHAAVDCGRPEIMRALLAAGADVNARDGEGLSCLHVAVFHGDAGILGELLAAGADVNARAADGRTALSMAEADGQAVIADVLLKAGAKRLPAGGTAPGRAYLPGA